MQPEGVGDLLATWGPFGFLSIRPVTGEAAAAKTEGIPGWVWIGIVVGLAVVAAGIILGRRRMSDEDRV
jgi:hypothetical protein